MEVTTLGIDVGKNSFHLVGLDQHGKLVLRKKATRANLVEFLANFPACRIGMEACASAQYWARRLLELGHDVRLIAAQFVKPFVKSQKNDFNDAEAIAEALCRPSMRFVAVRTIEQLELQALHRARELVVHDYVSLINQIRAFLLENGIALATGRAKLHDALPSLLEQSESRLTVRMRGLIEQLFARLNGLREERARFDAQLALFARENELCRLSTVTQISSPVVIEYSPPRLKFRWLPRCLLI
jgi:transposase